MKLFAVSVMLLLFLTGCSSITEEIVAALGKAPNVMQQTEISESSQSSEDPLPKEIPSSSSSTPKIIEVESSTSEPETTESAPPQPVEVNIPEIYGNLKIPDYSRTAARLKIISSSSSQSSRSQTSKPSRTNNSSKASSSSRTSSKADFVRQEKNYSKKNWPAGVVLATNKKTNKPVYHIYNCQAADKILPENEIWYDSVEDARRDGRVLCGICGK